MSGPRRIDFERLARALLDRAEQIVPQWLRGGRRDGREWKCGDLLGQPGDSCSVNLDTGRWADFATDEKGGDLISLYAAIHSLSNFEAAKALSEEFGLVDSIPVPPPPAARVTQKQKSKWAIVSPVPDGAPEYRSQWAHIRRGIPERGWEYKDAEGRLLGVACLFYNSLGKKEVLPLMLCRRGAFTHWRYVSFEQPRPLYGLWRLAALSSEKTVVVVEGEKCADALFAALGEKVPVVSWPGGCKAEYKADWTVLSGRNVICWPDADLQRDKKTGDLLPPAKQPGMKAMEGIAKTLTSLNAKVRIVAIEDMGELPDGWDCADAIADGWDGDRLRELLRTRLREPGKFAEAAPAPAPAADGKRERHPGLVYRRGDLVACVANVHGLVSMSQDWQGVIAFDEFSSRIVKLKAPPYQFGVEGEWDSIDDSRTAMWLSQEYQFTPATVTVGEAVEVLARENSFHPVRQYLQALKWDGTRRVDHWIVDSLGASASEYTRLVSRFFLLGMVARVMQPGCKFDYCLVLEGRQGQFKSSALRVIGGEWFKDTDLNLESKDSMSALQGAWLYEIQEMDSLNRAEASKQKSFLSRQVDEFRPTYARREVKLPRQLVFAGTTNQWEWNKDPTGGRRFWPVEVTDVNLDALRANRDQLFAEAYAMFQAGERYFPTSDEQRTLFDPEQLKRQAAESLVDALHDWVFGQVVDFSLSSAVQDGLKLDASKLTRDMQTRVGQALKALGCTRHEKRNGMTRFWYRAPAKEAPSSDPVTQAQPDSGGSGYVPI